jgi:hypothetical protein
LPGRQRPLRRRSPAPDPLQRRIWGQGSLRWRAPCCRPLRRRSPPPDQLRQRIGGQGSLGPVPRAAFTSLAGAQVRLTTCAFTVPSGPVQVDRHFLDPDFVAAWSRETPVDPFFGPIFKGVAATVGGPIDRHGRPVAGATSRSAGGNLIIRCGLLYRREQGEADRLCVPDGGGLRAHILQECHDTPLGGHFGSHKTAALVRRLAYWPGQIREVDSYVRSCGLLYPLPLPARRGGVIRVDWLVGLPMTASSFDQVQVHVDHLSGKVHAVPTRATDTAADAAQIILEMALRSGDGVPDVLVVDHDPKFTSKLFQEFTRRIGSSLLIGSAYHKNTNARAKRVNGVLGDTPTAGRTIGTCGCPGPSSPSITRPRRSAVTTRAFRCLSYRARTRGCG